MDPGEIGAFLVRTVNAILWVLVALAVLGHDRPVSPLTRRMIATVLVFGMVVLAIGATTAFGFPGNVARTIYTAFTAYAAIVALSILTTKGAL